MMKLICKFVLFLVLNLVGSNEIYAAIDIEAKKEVYSFIEKQKFTDNTDRLEYYSEKYSEIFIESEDVFNVFYTKLLDLQTKDPNLTNQVVKNILQVQHISKLYKVKLLYIRGLCQHDLQNHKEALYFFSIIEKDFVKFDLENELQFLKFRKANSNYAIGKLQESTLIYNDLLKEKYGTLSDFRKGAIYNNLANTYIELKFYEKALKYCSYSYNFLPPTKKKYAYFNYALIYQAKHDKAKFTKYIDLIKTAAQNKSQSDRDLLELYEFLGLNSMENMDYVSARDNFQKAEFYAKKIGNVVLLINILKEKGEVLLQLNQKKSALKTFQKAYNLAEKGSFRYQSKELAIKIADIYFEQKNFKDAYLYLKINKKWSDSLFSIDIGKKILEIDKRNEMEIKELRIDSLEKNKKIAEKEMVIKQVKFDKTKNYNIFLVVCTFLVSIMAIILFILIRLRKIKNLETIQNIEKEKEIVILKERVFGQELEKDRIAKELHDGVANNILAMIHDLPENIKKRLLKIYNEIRNLSHELYPPNLIGKDGLRYEIMDLIENQLISNEIEVDFTWYPENGMVLLPEKDLLSIYRIVQELTTNIVKHSKAKQVEIGITIHDSELNIMIYDNGKGFDRNSNRMGIGLKSIQERVDSMSGSLKIDSTEQSGCTVLIDIPLQNDFIVKLENK